MKETQKIWKFLKSETALFIFVTILIVSLFIVLSPKMSNIVFPQKRQATLNSFIENVKTKGTIDPQAYWEFREFYSPGFFTFSRDGISVFLSKRAKNTIGLTYKIEAIDLVYSFFSSQRLQSLDMLTKQSSLSGLIDGKQFQNGKLIFLNKNSLIYQKDDKTIKIVFLLTNEEMKKANGFFDYKDKDKKITEGENWFNITSFKSD